MKMALFLLAWLQAATLAAQMPFFDVPLITESSVGRAKLGMKFSELRKIYAGCAFTPVYLSAYGFDVLSEKPDAMLVSRNGRELFVYYDDIYDIINDKEVRTNRIAGLIALYPSYCTKQGIHTGSSSGELRRVLPSIKVAPSPIPLFDLQEARTAKSSLVYVFVGQKDLGPSDKKHHLEPVPLASSIGRISWIQVCCQ